MRESYFVHSLLFKKNARDRDATYHVGKKMTASDILKREFDGEDGSFVILARCELRWDWQLFVD